MYEIQLIEDKWFTLPTSHFRFATNGSKASQITNLSLKYDQSHLYIRFECHDNPFINQNSMTEHNEPLYNQEVFEVFISTGIADSDTYLEVEINPNNALWIGKIFNKDLGKTGELHTTMIPQYEANIIHSVEKEIDSWSGILEISWRLVGEKTDVYRINFYRIVAKKSQAELDWQCTPENSDFTCWWPTMSGEEPAFHRPKKFGVLRLG